MNKIIAQTIFLLKRNRFIYFLSEVAHFLFSLKFSKVTGGKKKYPKVIQLPITYKCNSNCVMCNICRMDHSGEFTIEEFAKFMEDDLFKRVNSVGINGGEPSLISNLHEYAEEILKLPSLKSLNIISNGFNHRSLFRNIEIIYQKCKRKNISFHVAISLDGFGITHDVVRGVPGAFDRTILAIDELIKNQKKYCDSYDIGCTVTKQNVNQLMELVAYAKSKNYNMKYRLGIANKRIESDKLFDNYSVLYSPLEQGAKEFFHYQFSQSKNFYDMFKYHAIFYWLNNSMKRKRLLGCMWKEDGVTIDARGDVYYCAVASKKIGSLRSDSGENIFFSPKNIKYRTNIINHECNQCIHDYSGSPEMKNFFEFFVRVIRDRFAMKLYEIKVRFIL